MAVEVAIGALGEAERPMDIEGEGILTPIGRAGIFTTPTPSSSEEGEVR
jgi:hypothetical protein